MQHIDRSFEMNISFEYYSIHQFHKLVKLPRNDKSFSIYHTNIESLNCNFERLHTQLAELDYPFDVIALSETWDPKYKFNTRNMGKLEEGYCTKNIMELVVIVLKVDVVSMSKTPSK